MTDLQFAILVLVLALSVHLTRALPFLLFGNRQEPPKLIAYLGRVLPAATMGLLVVYCFKDYSFSRPGELLPVLLASAAVIGLHLWKRSMILSISAGTAIYMILLRILPLLF